MPNGSDRRGWVTRGLRIFEPAVREARRRRRARRSLGYHILATIGLAYLASRVGVEPTLELGEVFWGTASVLAGASTVGAAGQLWRIERTPRPVLVVSAPVLPPASSAARAPIARLTARENALRGLLTVLGSMTRDTWQEAAAAAGALRRLGDQLVLLESARAGVPVDARPGLDAARSALQSRLEEGVSAYDRVVCAATDAVAATADGRSADPGAVRRLADAADSLTGLARGLREVDVLPRP